MRKSSAKHHRPAEAAGQARSEDGRHNRSGTGLRGDKFLPIWSSLGDYFQLADPLAGGRSDNLCDILGAHRLSTTIGAMNRRYSTDRPAGLRPALSR